MIAPTHSSDVRIELLLESGDMLPVAQLSDASLILRRFDRTYPAGNARLIIQIDRSRKETTIYLMNGIADRFVKYL